ncbi:Class I glutamine amidotransferase-like superfamily protein [Striga hermonthica]|uniref:Class I glutamine amidotransferase-like superfamily protein n=1 Tax=Striga hermonthica TaxID=68872 RepID=A0A9N7NBH9_STRHE|nr:Class I glutamine amidotransferase-like superfamily protein [Striga hermonthica]
MVSSKFAILMCAEDSDYIKRAHGGYYGVYLRMLKEDGETWDVYHVAGGTFPADDVVGDYDGFIITGSCNDAHGDDTWILTLLSLLHKLLAMEKKILGICFALGGRVERSKTGWDIGITKVNLKNSRFPARLEMPSSLSIIECHRDEVRELPREVEVLAWSEKTGVEMLVYGEHVVGIQGHPEYTKDILLHLIDRLITRNIIQESLGKEVKSKLGELFEADTQAWKKLCMSFLKGRLS